MPQTTQASSRDVCTRREGNGRERTPYTLNSPQHNPPTPDPDPHRQPPVLSRRALRPTFIDPPNISKSSNDQEMKKVLHSIFGGVIPNEASARAYKLADTASHPYHRAVIRSPRKFRGESASVYSYVVQNTDVSIIST